MNFSRSRKGGMERSLDSYWGTGNSLMGGKLTTHPSKDRGRFCEATIASLLLRSTASLLNCCRVLETPFRSSMVSVNQALAPEPGGSGVPGKPEESCLTASIPFRAWKYDTGNGTLRSRTGIRAEAASNASRSLPSCTLFRRRPPKRSMSLFAALEKTLKVFSSMFSPPSFLAHRSLPTESSSSRRRDSGPGSEELTAFE